MLKIRTNAENPCGCSTHTSDFSDKNKDKIKIAKKA